MTITTDIQDQDSGVMTERERYIDGLRVLAAVLEAHPDLPLPDTGTTSSSAVKFLFLPGFVSGDPRDAMAAAARLLPCSWDKKMTEADPDGRYPAYLRLKGQIGGLHVDLTALREAVCKRIVTGTREVIDEVPDPDALAAVPKVKVPRLVEDVVFDCGSLLRPVAEASVPELAG